MKKTTVVNVSNYQSVKRIVLAFSFMFVFTGSSVFATEPEVNEAVKKSFKNEFVGANLIEWNEAGDYLKATFILGNHRTEAYFSKDGYLEGSIRTLFYDELPLVVMTSVDKRFADAVIWDVNEINNSNGTLYRITLEVKHKKLIVRVDSNGNIKNVEKVRK